MNTRRQFLIAIAVLGFAVGIFLISIVSRGRQDQEPLEVFPATIQRDCAPWDGAAFTVSIPLEQSAIRISVYRSPEIRLPVTFSFPDETLREGSAALHTLNAVPDPLTGTVRFERVEAGKPVEGRFSLRSESGESLMGRFVAEWRNEIILCG